MLDQKSFFEKYNISSEDFETTGLKWEDLVAIGENYQRFREELEPIAIYLFNTLMKSPKVHSVRYRIKDMEHVLEKIIRKKIEFPDPNITIEDYKEKLNDLIGLRALHLYKEDWESVNDYIKDIWNLKGNPVANYRKGDSQDMIDVFVKKGCEAKEHKYGYRSVHYIIESQPAKKRYFAEIQVRTIFEEAWAEIDHTIRYPYHLENTIFFQFLLILNRLAGSADEMGSFVLLLKNYLLTKEVEFQTQLDEKTQIIVDMEAKIDKLGLQEQEIAELKADLERLRQQKSSGSLFDTASRVSEILANFNPGQLQDNFLRVSDALGGIRALGNLNDIQENVLKINDLINKRTNGGDESPKT